jgi:hypothetical protein
LPRIGREDDAKRFARFISDDDRNVEANFFIAFFTQMKAVETGRKILRPDRDRSLPSEPSPPAESPGLRLRGNFRQALERRPPSVEPV